MIWKKRFAEEKIVPVGDHSLVSVRRAGNGLVVKLISDLTGEETERETSAVVLEAGVSPMSDVFEALRDGSTNGGTTDLSDWKSDQSPPKHRDGYALFRIGDAAGSRNVQAAMFDALRLCQRL
ncbi:MAG: hypothetical protein AAGK00_09815 [Pseudomonadota bacterium]